MKVGYKILLFFSLNNCPTKWYDITMEKIRTTVNEKTIKELQKKRQITVLFAFCFGPICIGLYVLFGFLNSSWGNVLNMILLVLGAFLIALSIMVEFQLQKRALTYKKNAYESTYEFFDDHIVLTAYHNDEQFEHQVIKYKDLYGYYETTNYVVIKLTDFHSLPISKVSGLTEFLDSKGVIRRKK